MVDEFYATIKLITGEEIFGLVSVEEDTENPIILITHPVTMKMINAIEGSMVKLNTWLNVPGDDPVVIKWDKVVTMTEIKDKAIISIYNNYLEDEKFYITQIGSANKDNNVKNKLTDKMGYISTVNDARKYLEGIYKQSTKDS
tara:strand:- start:1153 stop:1581 length:429 start_codon:yes stop_codon:yes gene_type:complete